MRKFMYLLTVAVLLFIATGCGSVANNYNGPDSPSRFAYEQVNRRRSMHGAARRSAYNRPAPQPTTRQPIPRETIPTTPSRVVPRSPAHTQGQVVQVPDSRPYELSPQAMQPIPDLPHMYSSNAHVSPHAQAQPPVQAAPAATPMPTPATNRAGEGSATLPTAAKQELASHKTEFDANDKSRTTNITRASSSINGHIVQPGETFSYNQTVGPTIERRGYKEGTIFVQGEKKKGFGGGVCQVSTTLSIAADEAGMTIVERHDHSLPVTYAKEGEEAATSYGGIDFKFKNDKPHPVVIKSCVEGGTITVSLCEG
ncbi:MAG: VanW family protein [Defluviitaleaceae bacterium]|nr:VanW family protein [Defluviitaleaceae bacterium]